MRTVPFSGMVVLRPNHKPKTKITMQFLDKISKSNKIMAVVAIATLAIVAYVLVYKPWKEAKELNAPVAE